MPSKRKRKCGEKVWRTDLPKCPRCGLRPTGRWLRWMNYELSCRCTLVVGIDESTTAANDSWRNHCFPQIRANRFKQLLTERGLGRVHHVWATIPHHTPLVHVQAETYFDSSETFVLPCASWLDACLLEGYLCRLLRPKS